MMRPRQETDTEIDGLVLLAAAVTASEWLAAYRDQLNALNVFPVPDGDTGTNMLLTLREAVAAGQDAARTESGAGSIATALAKGAFAGARGNSGVILSQMIRGFAEAIAGRPAINGPANVSPRIRAAIAGRPAINGRDMASALSGARDRAYGAVLEPVEGTMLTVIRYAADQAEAAVAASSGEADMKVVLQAALHGAQEALTRTPELLDILRQASVVDAGGQGVVHILDGLVRFAGGEPRSPSVAEDSETHPLGLEMAFLDALPASHTRDVSGYCVNFVVFADEPLELTKARDTLGALGQSAEVVGDEQALRVHIHTEHPGPVLEYAASLGQLDRIQIDNMGLQTKRLIEQRSRAAAVGTQADHAAPAVITVEPDEVAVLAVAPGPGLADALRSMGAAAVISGGQTMNPSAAELVAGLTAIASDQVIILPNNANILLAAQQATGLTGKRVLVVPSRSVPQGLAALAVHSPEGPLDDNAQRMTRALAGVRTVEVTRAVRDATIDGVAARAGQAIGFVDDRLVTAGDDLAQVAACAVTAAGLDRAELVTIFTGEGAGEQTAAEVHDAIRFRAPRVAVEIVSGGQPHYPFVISVE